MKATLLALIMMLLAGVIYAQTQASDAYPFTSATDSERFHLLTSEIRCVVCQNQNIADSSAPLANDLREKVYRMVLDNKSNSEIENYLVKRYGEFILLQPRFGGSTLVLWVFPFTGVGIGLLILYFVSRSRRPTAEIK